jgi:hypothetical protein
VIPKHINNLYFKFDTDEEIKVVRLYDQDKPNYDNNGSVRQSMIRFVKVNDFHIDEYEEFLDNMSSSDEVILDSKHVPQKVWYVKHSGERILIEW